MLDWFRGQVSLHHYPLPAGKVLSINPNGDLDWQSVKKTRAVEYRGSHESSLQIRSVGGDGHGLATDLQIDGNLAKFLQGHNVFGSENLTNLVLAAFQRIMTIYQGELNGWCNQELAEQRIKRGDYLVKMIDINRMFDLGNDPSVESWLHAAEMKARTRAGRAVRDKGTVYLMKSSRRWGLKFYNKFRELKAKGKSHSLPTELLDSGLDTFSCGKLRAELRLQSLELKHNGVTLGRHVTPEWVDSIFNEYLGRVDMTTQATLIDDDLFKIPRCVQSTYQLWRQGVSLKDMLPKNSFYRHRRILLEQGIDITCPPSKPEISNVMPMFKVLEAIPVSTPQWAYDNGLIVG